VGEGDVGGDGDREREREREGEEWREIEREMKDEEILYW
jgi:hypothetical protein